MVVELGQDLSPSVEKKVQNIYPTGSSQNVSGIWAMAVIATTCKYPLSNTTIYLLTLLCIMNYEKYIDWTFAICFRKRWYHFWFSTKPSWPWYLLWNTYYWRPVIHLWIVYILLPLFIKWKLILPWRKYWLVRCNKTL